MEANNTFSLRRFMLFCRQSLIINKKMIGISLVGFVGTLFIALLFFQSVDHFQGWILENYIILFFFSFFGLGLIYTSLSFPAFRAKEKSMHYLMLPISSSEKFAFELITRIILFLILMPLLYWMVANIEGAIVHSYVREFVNYKFSFAEAYSQMTTTFSNVNGKMQPSQMATVIQYLFIQGGLFVFIFSFAGASHFSKSPLLKTLFTFSLIIGGYFLLIYLLFKGLDLREYNPVDNRVLTIKIRDENEFAKFAAFALTIINLTFLTIAWFRLKEKEV
jgi:hypothetical protein